MEARKPPFYDPELDYCVNELIPDAKNFKKIDDPDEYEPQPNLFGETFKQV